MNVANPFVVSIFVAFGVVVLFLVLREVWCWYWKINEALSLLKDIQAVLRNIDKHVAADFAEKQRLPDQRLPDHFLEPR
jgi:hypothetical protein